MSGYNGFSMSNNAVSAYQCGEMPLSKWTKAAILAQCGSKSDMLSKLTIAELRDLVLVKTSWHHTSCKYNRTDFYSIGEDALESVSEDTVNGIISRREVQKAEPADDAVVKAEITYTVWVGRYARYKKPQSVTETVTMKKSDKMVMTSNGNKRVSCLDSIRFIGE